MAPGIRWSNTLMMRREDCLTETKGNGVETVYGYDAAGRIASITNQLADASTVSFFNYTYDPNNNINSMTTSQGMTVLFV